MTREIKEDFEALSNFLNEYSLASVSLDDNYNSLLSSQHKKYYAVLTLLSEFKHQGLTPVKEDLDDEDSLNQAFLNYLTESISDLGSSLFVWLHGAYKAAKIILRSSLENFFRCMTLIFDPEVLKLKNTYELIDKFKQIKPLESDAGMQIYSALKDLYSLLCADVHTATVDNMQHVSALGYFPGFDQTKAKEFEGLFSRTAQGYVNLLCLTFSQQYFEMHHKNRDIIAAVLSKDVKCLIVGAGGT